MDRSGAKSRTGIRQREPLGDGTSTANASLHTSKSSRSTKSSTPSATASSRVLPHQESIPSTGGLSVREAIKLYESPHALTPQGSQKSARAARASAEGSVNRVSTEPIEEEDEDKRASHASASSQGSAWAHRKKRIGPWILGKDVGKGMVGRVRKVKHVYTGQIAAAKIIPKAAAAEIRAASLANLELSMAAKKEDGAMLPVGIEREVVIMKLLEHENVVKLFDVWENRSELYLIMEYVEGGELFDYVTNYEQLEEDETAYIFRQILAALLNAHRLGIYHRDLKPENILINILQDSESERFDPQVKLCDFGMAALQAKGRLLSTPCGSYHYAAPEVYDKHYDGSKADVWSLGVILYVMLTGMLPWEEVDCANPNWEWYQKIKTRPYTDQDWLSHEVRDLISRMLVVNPRKRITLESIWNHAYFEKWSLTWKETDDDRNLHNWIGPAPTISHFPVKGERDIDREILRNLRVLWHSEKEETLKKRLLSPEKNYEKLFYSSLLKHREEQLENFMGFPEDISVSASDHHHMRPRLEPEDLPPLPAAAYERTKSSLSILHDERPTSKNGTRRSNPSERSYDPYRSSKNPLVTEPENYNVTVHRSTSGHSRRRSVSQRQSSARADTIRTQQNRQSTASSSAWVSTRQSSPSPRRMTRRSMSRGSIVSSAYPSRPPGAITVKPSLQHRRGIDFSHVRRSSTMSALPSTPQKRSAILTVRNSGASQATLTPTKPQAKGKAKAIQAVNDPSNMVASEAHAPASSPPNMEESSAAEGRAGVKKSWTHNQVIKSEADSEARKVSVEFTKFCEEIFNRESSGSSYTTTNTTQAVSAYDTPASSVSNQGSAQSLQALNTSAGEAARRQGLILRDTPIARELADARKAIIERYGDDPQMSTSPRYLEVLNSIEYLLRERSRASQAEGRRVVSAPEAGSGSLPAHSGKTTLSEQQQATTSSRQLNAPISAYNRSIANHGISQTIPPPKSIRVVDDQGSVRVAPLNVRKQTYPPAPPSTPRPHPAPTFAASTAQRYYDRFEPQPQLSPRRPPPGSLHPLSPISEDAASHAQANHQGRSLSNKRSGWFSGWKSREDISKDDTSLHRVPTHRRAMRYDSADTEFRTQDVSSRQYATTTNQGMRNKRPGFLSLFTRKRTLQSQSGAMAIAGREANISQTALSQASSSTSQKSSHRHGFYHHPGATRSKVGNNEMQELRIERSWFSRFFNIKPASQPMCFRLSRGRVRTELVRLLRSWQGRGIEDVEYSRATNLVFFRLDTTNHVRLRPVAFVVQLFIVLEHGRHANLCIARFIQRKGAASSFRVTVAKIESVMRARGYIVEDGVKKKEMEGMLVEK